VLAGIAVPFADVPMITYLQSSVTDSFRGRVNSVREMISVGVMPISMVAAGSLVQFAGLSAAYLVMGGIMIAACLIGLLSVAFREAKMPVAQEYHITPEHQEAASVA
jgi:Na+/melibiose symporter-like transporter